MNIKNLNKALVVIAEKKNKLSNLRTGSLEYNRLKGDIDSLVNTFKFEYGHFIEEVLFTLYDEYCSDDEVMEPESYIASKYETRDVDSQLVFDISPEEGVPVDADDFPGIRAKLVMVPNPVRFVLQGEKEQFKETIWSLDNVSES